MGEVAATSLILAKNCPRAFAEPVPTFLSSSQVALVHSSTSLELTL